MTAQAVHTRLTKTVALAVFSSDALSSVVIAKECSLPVAASHPIAHRERSHEVCEKKHDMECTTLSPVTLSPQPGGPRLGHTTPGTPGINIAIANT